MLLLLALARGADDHQAVAPTALRLDAVRIPDGPPRTVTARPGESLQNLVGSLPRGSHLVLAAGEHQGPLLIDRPMELSGEPGAVLDGGGRGSVLVVAAPDVHVHDLEIRGGGHLTQNDDAGVVVGADRSRLERVGIREVYLGIDFRMASDSVVEDCRIHGDPEAPFGKRGDAIRLWESYRNTIRGNDIRDARDLVVWYANDNLITGNRVSGSRYGTHLMHSDHNRIVDNRFVDNVVGIFVMYSEAIELRGNEVSGSLGPAGVGFGFKESNAILVEGNRLVGNTTGLFLDTTPHRMNGEARFAENVIAANEVGIRFHGPQYGGEMVHNAFGANRTPVAVDGQVDSGRYRIEGNHWSDYAGYDLDGDGYGDLPFEAHSLAATVMERDPNLLFFVRTPAATLLDLFAEAFPMFRPKPLLTDPKPLMEWS